MTTLTLPHTRGGLRRARIGVTTAFTVHAMMFASWTAHIPIVKAQLGLSNAGLGTALVGAPIGSVCAMLISSWLLPRWGSPRMLHLTFVGYCLASLTIGYATSGTWLFATLMLWGLFQGGLDVAMNTQAVTVEHAMGRPIMARLHGMWSVGGLSGALIGAAMVSCGIGLDGQMFLMAGGALIAGTVLTRALLPDQSATEPAVTDRAQKHSRSATLSRGVILLGVVSFASMLCEGAAADWSATYLSTQAGASAGLAGLGYAGYTLTMVITRFCGPALQSRYLNRVLLPLLAIVSAVAVTVALMLATPVTALVGFASMGLGLALIVPTAFSAAGAATDGKANAGPAVATVAAMGWIGYLTGPPVIGHLAEVFTLPLALALLPVLIVAIALTIRGSTAFNIRTADDGA